MNIYEISGYYLVKNFHSILVSKQNNNLLIFSNYESFYYRTSIYHDFDALFVEIIFNYWIPEEGLHLAGGFCSVASSKIRWIELMLP